MSNRTKCILIAGIILAISLSACQRTVTEIKVVTPAPTSPPTPTPEPTAKSLPLATPYSQEPAAGMCTSPEGELVVVNLYADMPDPRCSKVKPSQTLSVINQTQDTLEVSIGRFSTSLAPGTEFKIDTPFGDFLEPGVHQLQVSPCCGAEIWLVDE